MIFKEDKEVKYEMEESKQAQVLIAKYTSENYFKIPVGIDLDDEEVIEYYGVKWNTLTISFVDKNKEDLEIECYHEGETDYKYPTDIDVGNMEDAPEFLESEEED